MRLSPTLVKQTVSMMRSEAESRAGTEGSPLLRSWRNPPVAPAFVVEDDEQGPGRYTYPVATFVRDLVRTSMDQMNNSEWPTLVRSEGDIPALGDPPAAEAQLTVRTLNDLEDDAEFILVDGDLIAVPPPPPNAEEQEGYEDNLRLQVRTCQPNRFRKGVRRLNKLFKRYRVKPDDIPLERISSTGSTASSTVTSTRPGLTPSVTGGGPGPQTQTEGPTTTTSTTSTTTTTPVNRSSPNRKQKRRNNKRMTWRREEGDSSSSDVMSFGRTSFPASTGLDALIPVTPIGERLESVTASYMGTADMLEAGVLPAGIAAEAYIEYDDFAKKDDAAILPALMPRDTDYKVDKTDVPDFEDMLRRAAFDTTHDLESSEAPTPIKRHETFKSGDGSVPLSLSCHKDEHVHNDTLKVIMVGCLLEKTWLARAIRQSTKRPRKRSTLAVDVHTWAPSDDTDAVKFSLWDVQGASSTIEGSPNFGGHPATQSLFFAPQSLYVLVWDLAGHNPKTNFKLVGVGCHDSDGEEDEYDDDFVREEASRQADRVLEADIRGRVLSWVDCIARRGPKSAILPVGVIPEGMSDEEANRRCSMMQNLLEAHIERFAGDVTAPKLLTGTENILCVNYEGVGLEQLRETILAIALDSSRSVFDHIGTTVPRGTAMVLDVVHRLKQDHKLILTDHLLGEVGSALDVQQVMDALHFLSSIGEVLYFGTEADEVLSRYVILSRKWLVSALSCILRNDLRRELEETRRFMNMQCLYSSDKFQENEVAHVLAGATTSSCPLLSGSDAKMLWHSMTFMREAADRYNQFSDMPTTAPTMYAFLERLLVHSGILVPLHTSQSCPDESRVFFVPSLLAQVDPRDIWTFRSSESWTTTLCHSWLLRDGASSDLMEGITVGVLRDLYEFSRSFLGTPNPRPRFRAKTVPVAQGSLHEFYEDHNEQTIGRIRIHQIMCWESSILVKVGSVFADSQSDELRESFTEILVTVVDQSSNHCVASDAMRAGMHRVVVSGKGQVGHHGRKIWKGGYRVVLDSVRKTLESHSNVDSQVVCPECLAHYHPHSASTWSWDSVRAAAESGSDIVRCIRGHRVNSNLICGTCSQTAKAPPVESGPVKAVGWFMGSCCKKDSKCGIWFRSGPQTWSCCNGRPRSF